MMYSLEISFITFIMIATIIFLIVESYKFKNKQCNNLRRMMKVIFFIYFLGVVYYTFFPITIEINDPGFHFNTVPFEETLKVLNNNINIGLYNVIGNIVLLLPLGFFVPLFYKRGENLFATTGIIFLSTLSIEFLQIFTSSRIGDVDDIIFNTIGGILGFILFKIIKVIMKIIKKHKFIEKIQSKESKIIKTAIVFVVPIVIIMSLIIQVEKIKYIDSLSYTTSKIKEKKTEFNEGNLVKEESYGQKYYSLIEHTYEDGKRHLTIYDYDKVKEDQYIHSGEYMSSEIVDKVDGVVDFYFISSDQKFQREIVVFGKNNNKQEIVVEFQQNKYCVKVDKGYFIIPIKMSYYRNLSQEINCYLK